MSFLRRAFGLIPKDGRAEERELLVAEIRVEAQDADERLVEIDVVGESHRQEALASIAGPKEALGKHLPVGVALRCEPSNTYDANAIRVEVMGQLLGYVAREPASILSPNICRAAGGVIEARGLIVGGWDDGMSVGHYGIRVWLTERDCSRLSVPPADVDKSPPARQPWPVLPAVQPGERRLSPTDEDIAAERWASAVTVICEEHYQDALVAAMPANWKNDQTWPLLVDLVVTDCNPHSKQARPCVEVSNGGRRIGFFTPAMTDRYLSAISQACGGGSRATAAAQASKTTKAGAPLWRVKVQMVPTAGEYAGR